jgi:Flp pilus assembly protein TadB
MLAPLLRDVKETRARNLVRQEMAMTRRRRAASMPRAEQARGLRYSRFRLVSWGVALVACLLIWWAVMRGTIALIAMIH